MTQNTDELYALIDTLLCLHSPSGNEAEIDAFVLSAFEKAGLQAEQDHAGNIIAKISGSGGGALAITAHKDEIGALVTNVSEGGRVQVKKLGGSYPWIYGEGLVELLGEHETVTGVLSFGARHVSPTSPQGKLKDTLPLLWENCWIETKRTKEELLEAGVRPGTRMLVHRSRKKPHMLGEHIAGYALDDKAALATLLMLASQIREPFHDIYLCATAGEEPGALGALYMTQRTKFDALIALEVAPVADENNILAGEMPALLAEDSYCAYTESLNNFIRDKAGELNIQMQTQVVNSFGSDASISMRYGHIGQGACLAFATENTHGFEIAHLNGIENMMRVVEAVCNSKVISY